MAVQAARKSQQPSGRMQADIGEEVRKLRRGLDLTVAQLGAASGLSVGMLSKVENGLISPSLTTLSALAKALNVSMRELFPDGADEPFASHVPNGQGARMHRRGTKAGYVYQLLLTGTFSVEPTIEPYLITVSPDAVPHSTFQHSGNEFLHMLTGRMSYRHGQRTYVLKPGDTLFFEASARHGPVDFIRHPISYLSIITYPNR
jgi:transcriptional regulator with XRE-family HTH domain